MLSCDVNYADNKIIVIRFFSHNKYIEIYATYSSEDKISIFPRIYMHLPTLKDDFTHSRGGVNEWESAKGKRVRANSL